MMKFIYLAFLFSVPAQAQTVGTGAAVSSGTWQPPPVTLFGNPAVKKETWEKQVQKTAGPEKTPKKTKTKKNKKKTAQKPKETPPNPPEPKKKLSPYRHFRKVDAWSSNSPWAVEQPLWFIDLKEHDNRLTFKSGRPSYPGSLGSPALPYYYWFAPKYLKKQDQPRPSAVSK